MSLVNKTVYDSTALEIKKFLKEKYPSAIFLEASQFSKQENFTHLIILHSHVSSKEIHDQISSSEFNSKFFFQSEDSFRLVFLEFQLKDLFMGYCYYSYNLGFLLKELVEPLGLVLTDKGLFKDEELLSNSWLKICDILDLSFKTWERGFKDSEELFHFISYSRFLLPKKQPYSETLAWTNRYNQQIWNRYQKWLIESELHPETLESIQEKLKNRIEAVLS